MADKAASERARHATTRNASIAERDRTQYNDSPSQMLDGNTVNDATLEEGKNVNKILAKLMEEAAEAERERIQIEMQEAKKANCRLILKEKRRLKHEEETRQAVTKAVARERERLKAQQQKEMTLLLAKEKSYQAQINHEATSRVLDVMKEKDALQKRLDAVKNDFIMSHKDGDNREDAGGDDLSDVGVEDGREDEEGKHRNSPLRVEDTVMTSIDEEAAAINTSERLAAAMTVAKAALEEARTAKVESARKLSVTCDVASMARIDIARQLASEKASTAVKCLTPGQAMPGVLLSNFNIFIVLIIVAVVSKLICY